MISIDNYIFGIDFSNYANNAIPTPSTVGNRTITEYQKNLSTQGVINGEYCVTYQTGGFYNYLVSNQVTSTLDNNNIAIEFLIKFSSNLSSCQLISIATTSTNFSINIYFDNNTIGISSSGGTSEIITGANITAGLYHHIVITGSNASVLKIYIDGKYIASSINPYGYFVGQPANKFNKFSFFSNQTTQNVFYYLKFLKVYNLNLNQGQVNSLYLYGQYYNPSNLFIKENNIWYKILLRK